MWRPRESYPEELRYHKEHDWARVEGEEAALGITWYAQEALGELVHFEAPEKGHSVAKDESYGEVESVKAVSELVSDTSEMDGLMDAAAYRTLLEEQ